MGQYATFKLEYHYFGQSIQRVREIIRCCHITPVPRSKPHIRGLINLRGQVVTIVDLAVRLGMPRREIGNGSRIIILKPGAELATGDQVERGSQDLVGFLVDAIGDVVDADDNRIEAPSANVGEAAGRFLSGVITLPSGLLVLLNLRNVLGEDGA